MRAKNRLLATVGIIVLIAALAATVWFAPVFKVGGFKIEGQVNTSAEDIQSATRVMQGDNLLRVDSQAAARGVSALPWVETVSVSKSFPSTVHVVVKERTVSMWVKRSDGNHLIDEKGRPFLIGDAPAGAPEVTGQSDDNQQLFEALAGLIGSLDDATRHQLTAIEAKSEFEITLQFGADKQVYWGSTDNQSQKALATQAALKRPEARFDVSGAPTIAVRP